MTRTLSNLAKNTIIMPQFWPENVDMTPGDVKPSNLGSQDPQILCVFGPGTANISWQQIIASLAIQQLYLSIISFSIQLDI